MRKIKLICIPYAGGSMQIYKSWNRYLNNSIELNSVELAGRGRRFSEPRYENMEAAVNDVYKKVRPLIQDSEYSVFGHSMGSIIVYELLNRLRDDGLHNPEHAFFSGRYPPFTKKNKPNLHDAPLEVFIEEIKKLGGTSKELLENVDFVNFFIPILRADYKIIESYSSLQKNTKFEFDISVLSGKQDEDMEDKDLEMWQTCTSGKCSIYKFDGGHFFINEKIEDIVKIINSVLIPYAS